MVVSGILGNDHIALGQYQIKENNAKPRNITSGEIARQLSLAGMPREINPSIGQAFL